MKKLEIIVKPGRLKAIKKVFDEIGVSGLTITNIMGYGRQKGYTQIYRGETVNVDLLPKVKIEAVIGEDTYERVIEIIQKTVSTKTVDDSEIFVYDVCDVLKIKTGETDSGNI